MARRDEPFEICDALLMHERPTSIKISSEQLGDEPVWLPLSQVIDRSEIPEEGDTGTITITEWLAIERGWD